MISEMMQKHVGIVSEAESGLSQISAVVDSNAEIAENSQKTAQTMAQKADELYRMVEG